MYQRGKCVQVYSVHRRVKVMRIMHTHGHMCPASCTRVARSESSSVLTSSTCSGGNQPASSVKILRITRHVLHGCSVIAWVDVASWMGAECASFRRNPRNSMQFALFSITSSRIYSERQKYLDTYQILQRHFCKYYKYIFAYYAFFDLRTTHKYIKIRHPLVILIFVVERANKEIDFNLQNLINQVC